MTWQEELKKLTFDVDLLRNDNGDLLHKKEVIPFIASLLEKQEKIIMQEAFMTGRVYASMGEKESPIKIQEILEKNCGNALKRNAPDE